MDKRCVVVSFGCPHSGTTYMMKLLERGKGYLYFPLREIHEDIHPATSKTGLLTLIKFFNYAGYDHLFVRTKRDPLDIFESFYAKKYYNKKNLDEKIYDFIFNESLNVYDQKQSFKKCVKEGRIKYLGKRFNLVEVKYEDLYDVNKQRRFIQEIVSYLSERKMNQSLLLSYLNNTFGKKSKAIRKGKLSMGIEKNLVSEAKRKEIRKKLKEVFKREGYN